MRRSARNPARLSKLEVQTTPIRPAKRGPGSPRKTFTEEEIEFIHARFVDGWSAARIARHLHVGNTRVLAYFAEHF